MITSDTTTNDNLIFLFPPYNPYNPYNLYYTLYDRHRSDCNILLEGLPVRPIKSLHEKPNQIQSVQVRYGCLSDHLGVSNHQ